MHSEPQLAATLGGSHVGQAVERLEDAALLTGRGSYADDRVRYVGEPVAVVIAEDRYRFTRARVCPLNWRHNV